MGRVRRSNVFTALALGLVLILFCIVALGSVVRADGTASAKVDRTDGDQAWMTVSLSGYSDYDEVTVVVELSRNDIYVSDYPSIPLSVSGEGSEILTITVTGYYHNPNGSYEFWLTGMDLDGMTASVSSTSVVNNKPSVTPSPSPTATPSTPTPKPATPTPVPTTAPTTAPVAPTTDTATPTPEATPTAAETTPSETEESKTEESATPTPTPTGTVTPTPTPSDTPTPTKKASPTPTRPPFGDGERDRSEPSEEADPSDEGSIPTKAATNLAAVTTDDNNKKGPGIGSAILGVIKFVLILAVIAIIARILVLKANGTYNEDLLKEFIPRKKKDPVVEQANAVNGYLQKSNTAAVRPMYSNAPTRPSRFDDEGGIGKSNMADAKDVSDKSDLSD